MKALLLLTILAMTGCAGEQPLEVVRVEPAEQGQQVHVVDLATRVWLLDQMDPADSARYASLLDPDRINLAKPREPLDSNRECVDCSTSAGTYVHEPAHGPVPREPR